MGRTLKSLKVTTALLLALLTAILLPVQVGAQTANGTFSAVQTEPSPPEDEENTAEQQQTGNIVAELTEKRDATTKYFKLDDGSFIAAQYEMPVHYEGENGQFVDYDNRLEEIPAEAAAATFADLPDEDLPSEENQIAASSNDGNASVSEGEMTQTSEETVADEAESTAEDATEYKNKKSDLDIRFSKKSKENNMVKLGKGQSKISWGFAGTNKSQMRIEDASQETLSGNDAFMSLPNLTQTVTYPEAYAGVDLQYIVSSVGIKENIILKNAQAKRSYSVEYRMKGLTPVQVDEKTIALRDKNGADVYTLTAPMMTDAAGAMSTDITLTLTEAKNNKFTVQLSVDEEWIADSARVFPVVIDPDIQTSQSWGKVQSSYVDSATPGTAYGYGSSTGYVGSMYVGKQYTMGKSRTLIKIPSLPSLSPGDIVINAQMSLFQYNTDATMLITAHHVTGSWTQSAVTWNNQPSFESKVVDYVTPKAKDGVAWRDFDVTQSFTEPVQVRPAPG